MNLATIHRYIKKQRTHQDLSPGNLGPKGSGRLSVHRELIVQLVSAHSDWTLRRYQDYLLSEYQIDVSTGWLCEFLQKEGLTLKKKNDRATA